MGCPRRGEPPRAEPAGAQTFPLMAILHHSTPRWRDAPQPRQQAPEGGSAGGPEAGSPAPAPGPDASTAAASQARRARRARRIRRLTLRALPVALVLGGVGALATWASAPSTMSPEEVARAAHEQVVRDVVDRTGDFSTTVGKLDCVEIAPGRGNCLADVRSEAHQADALMIAVGYVVDPDDGQLELVVKLP